MSTLYTFWDTIIPYRTEGCALFWGLMNSATKMWRSDVLFVDFCLPPDLGVPAPTNFAVRRHRTTTSRKGFGFRV